jgi:NAD(P)H-flavin reductase
VIRYAFSPKSTLKDTKLVLLFANNTENDILFQEEFDTLQRTNPEKFSVHYAIAYVHLMMRSVENFDYEFISFFCLTKNFYYQPSREVHSKRTYEIGFVNEEMIRKYLPPPHTDNLILICGPPPMEVSVTEHLKRLGYTPEVYFSFTVSQQPYIQGSDSILSNPSSNTLSHDKGILLTLIFLFLVH